MKKAEKEKARLLRSQGYSVREIYKELGVAKSSVSLWVRDIVLPPQHKKRLMKKGVSLEVIERRRATRLNNEEISRQAIITQAASEISELGLEELRFIGPMLYWAEGGKTQRMVRFSNSDPMMIKVMMLFFRKICCVPERKFRGIIHIHSHLDYKNAEQYWSEIAGVPLNQFYKTYRKRNKSSKNKRDNLPFGTFDVYVCDVKLFFTIQGWIQGITSHLLKENST